MAYRRETRRSALTDLRTAKQAQAKEIRAAKGVRAAIAAAERMAR